MKILKLSSMSLAVLISCFLLWAGCSKSEKKEICFKCKPKPPALVKDIQISSQPFSAGVYGNTTHPNFIFSKEQNESNATDNRMREIINTVDVESYFGQLLKSNHTPVFYGLYLNKNIREEKDFDKKDILALSIITYKDFGLHHYLLLQNENGKLIINEKYSAETDGINVKDVKLIFDRVLDKKAPVVSVFNIVNPIYMEVMSRVKTKNKLRAILLSNDNASNRTILIRQIEPEECDPDVCTPIQDTEGECKEFVGGMGCVEIEDEQECPFRTITNAYNKISEFNQMKHAFYTLRDSVLLHSINGQNVIDNYYLADKHLRANMSELDLGLMYNYVSLLHSKVTILLADTDSNQILFDVATKNDALSLIASLRGIDPNQEWIELLDWLEGLVNQFANRPVHEVFNYLD